MISTLHFQRSGLISVLSSEWIGFVVTDSLKKWLLAQVGGDRALHEGNIDEVCNSRDGIYEVTKVRDLANCLADPSVAWAAPAHLSPHAECPPAAPCQPAIKVSPVPIDFSVLPRLFWAFMFNLIGGTRLELALDEMALLMTPTGRQLYIQQNM